MKLISIKGENWGKHPHIDINLADSNWLKGPNDSGKSTIVRGIQFCLDTSSGAVRSHGRGYALRQGTESGWLELTFEFGNARHTILKTFSDKSPAKTKIDGENLTLADADQKFLEWGAPPSSQRLGLTILEQGLMHALITERASNRLTRINELMGMQPVQELRKKVKKERDANQTKKEALLSGGIDEKPKEEQKIEEDRLLEKEEKAFKELAEPETLKKERNCYEYHEKEESCDQALLETESLKNSIPKWAEGWANDIQNAKETHGAQTLIDRAAENVTRKKQNEEIQSTKTKANLKERMAPFTKNKNPSEIQAWLTQLNKETSTTQRLEESGVSPEEAKTLNLDKINRAIELSKNEYTNLEKELDKIPEMEGKGEGENVSITTESHLNALWAEMERQKESGNPWEKDLLTGDIIDPKALEKSKEEALLRKEARNNQKEIQEFLKKTATNSATKGKDLQDTIKIIRSWKPERESVPEKFRNSDIVDTVQKYRAVMSEKDLVPEDIRPQIKEPLLKQIIELKEKCQKLPEPQEVGEEVFESQEQQESVRKFEKAAQKWNRIREELEKTQKPLVSFKKLEIDARKARIVEIETLITEHTEKRVSIKNRKTRIKELTQEIENIKKRKKDVSEIQKIIDRLNDSYEFLDSKRGPQKVITTLFSQILENANNVLNNVGANIEMTCDEELNLYAGNPMEVEPELYPPASLLGFGKATLCGISMTLALREFYNQQNPGAQLNTVIADEPSAFVEKHILPQLYKEIRGDDDRMIIVVEHDPLVESICEKIIEPPFGESPTSEKKDILSGTFVS